MTRAAGGRVLSDWPEAMWPGGARSGAIPTRYCVTWLKSRARFRWRTVIGRLVSKLKRLLRQPRLVAIAAAALVALNIVASALTPASHEHRRKSGTPARPVP